MKNNKDTKREIKQRLKLCYKHLKKQGRVESYSDIAKEMDATAVTVRGAFSTASPYLSNNFLSKFIQTYKETFSEQWLLTGEGEMLLETAPLFRHKTNRLRGERVVEVMRREGLTPTTLGREIGINHTTIMRIANGQSTPRDNTLEQIIARYPHYSRAWLFDGKGELFAPKIVNTPTKQIIESNATFAPVENIVQARVIPDKAFAGTLTGYGDPDPDDFKIEEIPVDKLYKGEYYIFNVSGASMDDGSIHAIADGDQVLCKYIDRELWFHGLHKRQWRYFVFITRDQGVIIKSIAEQDLKNDTVTCRSINPDYPDIILHLRDVVAIFNVVKLIRNDMRN